VVTLNGDFELKKTSNDSTCNEALEFKLKRVSLRISKPLCKIMLKYRVIIEKDEDGVLVAKVPDLPGCATEGKTRQELMKNVKEAIQAYLEALKEHGDPVPIETVLVKV
jgi:predicted RNase H-like HicB family nuclease